MYSMILIPFLLPLQRTRNRLDEESRCHEDIVQYLKTHQGMLEGKLEYWIAKYEKDTEEKSRELDILKSSKAKDLERLQELTKLVSLKFYRVDFHS